MIKQQKGKRLNSTSYNHKRRRLNGIYDANYEASVYDDFFYERDLNQRNAFKYRRNISNYILENFEFESIVDLGCGVGDIIKPLEDKKKVLGIDFSVGSKNNHQLKNENFLHFDLTNPLNLNKEVDIVLSLETYEHIPKKFEEIFVKNILSFNPKYIILSVAAPGQIGRRHHNCKPLQYVIDQFMHYGYNVNENKMNIFKTLKYLPTYYRYNTLVFEKA